jgi:hypothetical protein
VAKNSLFFFLTTKLENIVVESASTLFLQGFAFVVAKNFAYRHQTVENIVVESAHILFSQRFVRLVAKNFAFLLLIEK